VVLRLCDFLIKEGTRPGIKNILSLRIRVGRKLRSSIDLILLRGLLPPADAPLRRTSFKFSRSL
jgi:hypothetical protein